MPVPRQLPLTADQELATGRRDLQGVVYLLSGTLPGRRGGTEDAEFRWATRTFSGALGAFEAYIRPPSNVLRGQSYLPGAGAVEQGTRIPVRNLAFGGSASLLAAIDDGIYAWEHADADLRVGYLKPGQGPEDLAAEDWTHLVKGGFFGAPDDLEVDGFTLVLYGKGAKRNQLFRQPLTPTSGEVYACDRKDLGVPYPVVIGAPDSWYKPPVRDLGIRGFTVSGYGTGATTITFRRITEGTERPNNTSVRLELVPEQVGGTTVSGDVWYIHRQAPLYQSLNAQLVYEEDGDLVTIELVSGLAADVPRGAFVQQHYIARIPGRLYTWYLADYDPLDGYQRTGWLWRDDLRGNVGWLLGDGTVKVADETIYTFENQGKYLTMYNNMYASVPRWQSGKGVPPCYFDPTEESIGVSSQPQFTSNQLLSSKLNYPTGGPSAARDGNELTGTSLGVGAFITMTFNSAPAPFDDTDTTNSVLHVVVQGDVDFKNSLGTITFGQAVGAGGNNRTFRFAQGSARNYNESVKCIGAGGSGGTVVEVWWEHDLSTEEDSTRTQDVVVGASGSLGPVMQYAELVFRMPSTKGGYQGKMLPSNRTHVVRDYADESSEIGNAAGSGYSIDSYYHAPYPTAVMATLQWYFLGADPEDINAESYGLALAKFKEHDIRLNFVLQEPISSWTELEQDIALQSRARMYYGPSGHEIVFMDEVSGMTASGIVQEFRLPGAPGTNALRGGRPLLERLGASEIVNTIRAKYDPDYVEDGSYRDNVEVQEADSVGIFGERRDPRTGGDYQFWAHSPYRTHPTYDAGASVSGILRHYVDRGAFATTRFNFDTAWLAHGVDRGSPVRAVYEVSKGEYRNVVCEVEEIGVSPLNGERFTLRCRALELPARGLPAYTWVEVFDDPTDLWTDELLAGEAWLNRWSIF